MKATLEGESHRNNDADPGSDQEAADAPLVPPDWLKEDIRNFTSEKKFRDAPSFVAGTAIIKKHNVSLNMENYDHWHVEKKKQAPRLKTAAQLIEPMLESLSARGGAASHVMERVTMSLREKHDQQIAEHQRYFRASLRSPRRPQTLRASLLSPRGGKNLTPTMDSTEDQCFMGDSLVDPMSSFLVKTLPVNNSGAGSQMGTTNPTGGSVIANSSLITDSSSSFSAKSPRNKSVDFALQLVQLAIEQEEAKMVYEATKKLLVFAPISFFCQGLARHLRVLNIRKNVCSGKIARTYRAYRARMIVKRLRAIRVTFPLSFNIAARIWRKIRALRMLQMFFKDHIKFGLNFLLKRLFVCVKKGQQVMKCTLRILRCRRQLLHIYWDKLEHQIRNKDLKEEAARAERLRRDIAKRATETGPAGTNDIHAKWARRHRKAQSLLLHLDAVQTKYHRVVEQELARAKEAATANAAAASAAAAASTSAGAARSGRGRGSAGIKYGFGRGGGKRNGGRGGDGELVAATDFNLREEVIRIAMFHKRRMHVQAVDDMKRREATNQLNRSGLNLSHARKLLLDFDESASIIIRKQLTSSMSHGSGARNIAKKKFRHNIRMKPQKKLDGGGDPSSPSSNDGQEGGDQQGGGKQNDKEEDKKAKVSFRWPPFLCLTDPSLGPSWKEIITEVVNEEMLKEKEAAARVIEARNTAALHGPTGQADGKEVEGSMPQGSSRVSSHGTLLAAALAASPSGVGILSPRGESSRDSTLGGSLSENNRRKSSALPTRNQNIRSSNNSYKLL